MIDWNNKIKLKYIIKVIIIKYTTITDTNKFKFTIFRSFRNVSFDLLLNDRWWV